MIVEVLIPKTGAFVRLFRKLAWGQFFLDINYFIYNKKYQEKGSRTRSIPETHDDEIIGRCRKVLKGIDVDAAHLAVEVVEAVDPGGNFMMSPHTIASMRKEYFRFSGLNEISS